MLALGTSGIAGLAGCLGDETDETATRLETAQSELEAANDDLSTEADRFGRATLEGGGVDVRTDSVETHLDAASSALDRAEETASEDVQANVDVLRDLVSFLRDFVELLDLVAAGHSALATAFTYFGSERYDDAVDELDSATTSFEDAQSTVESARSRADAVDTDQLEDANDADVEELHAHLDRLDDQLGTYLAVADGFRDFSLGMQQFQSGTSRLDEERFGPAEAAYLDAADRFSDAEAAFRAEEEESPENVRSAVIELTCVAEAIGDASEHFANAAAALDRGDSSEAEEQSSLGEEAADRCNFG